MKHRTATYSEPDSGHNADQKPRLFTGRAGTRPEVAVDEKQRLHARTHCFRNNGCQRQRSTRQDIVTIRVQVDTPGCCKVDASLVPNSEYAKKDREFVRVHVFDGWHVR